MRHSLPIFALALSVASTGSAAALPSPENVRAVAQDGEVALAWDAVPGAQSYTISHSMAPGGPYTVLAEQVTETHHVAKELRNDVRHYFAVSAVGQAGLGPASAEVSGVPFQLWPEGDEWPYTFRRQVKKQHAFFHLWVPPNTETLKGIFVFTYHGCGGTFAEHHDMRYLAASLDCAIVGLGGETTKRGFSPSSILFEALADLGRQSDRPELIHAPIFTFGHSNGTGFAAGFTNQEPERVIGWIAFKSANGSQFSLPPIYRVPGLVLSGEKDKTYFNNQLDTVEALRREHDAMMGMIVEAGAGHGPNRDKSYKICLAFMRNVFRLRVPADADPRDGPVKLIPLDPKSGWLGKNWDKKTGGAQKLYAAPHATFEGDAKTASWLPNADFARCWKIFCATGDLPVWW